jgi:hypothetical protein
MKNQHNNLFNIDSMPEYGKSMERVESWFNQELIDRPPIRFSKHNVIFENDDSLDTARWPTFKERWFDVEYQVDSFIERLKGQKFYAESFPVFWPNLGPEIYAAFYGSQLEFREVTSWSTPLLKNVEDPNKNKIQLNKSNAYYLKLKELTKVALEKCQNRYMVGLTSWCPGIDCVASWIEPQLLCMDLIKSPKAVQELLKKSYVDFQDIYDAFYDLVSNQHSHPSVSWMGIPTDKGKHHISQSDFAAMISPEHFEKFCLPNIEHEVKPIDRNIFHMDGKGVANHLDMILKIPEINAIQWVQGVGDDEPIIQWVPLIKKIQNHGKSVVVDLKPRELEEFISLTEPNNLFLCIAADEDVQPDIIKRIERW